MRKYGRLVASISIIIQWNSDITILDVTMNILCTGKSYTKMYGTEPRYNDLRCNGANIADRRQNLSRYNDIICTQSQIKQTIEFNTITLQSSNL